MKYRITEFTHPKYPWLHRIQAVTDIGEHVKCGDLGGFVQSEDNLSQEGTCWIYDRAICCEDAYVTQAACMYDDAVAKECAWIGGTATMHDEALAEGDSIMKSGSIREKGQIAGDAFVTKNERSGYSPLIFGSSRVYGSISGSLMIKDLVPPGVKLDNPTKDYLVLENGRWEAIVEEHELHPPESYQKKKKTKSRQPER